ncbi:hypothetical protein OAP32_02800 [Crocinitomicaceae bacterium]|nr:hypothetical protein [Crocinitomicaceae bacterium]
MKRIEIIGALFGDAALPLLGFLFWDWGFYFIVLFFVFDILIRSFFLMKRVKNLPSMNINHRFALFGISMTLLELSLLHLLVFLTLTPIGFFEELWAFLSYEEMGIAQGVVLIPLLIFNELFRIRNEQKAKVPQNVRFEILKSSQYFQFGRLILWCIVIVGSCFLDIKESVLVAVLIATLCVQPFYVFRNIS